MVSSFESLKLEVLRLRELGISWGLDDQDIDEAIKKSLREDLDLSGDLNSGKDVLLREKRSKFAFCFSWFLKLVVFFTVVIAVNYTIAKYHTPYMLYITKQGNHLMYPLMRILRFLILPLHSITPVSTMKAIGFWDCIIDNPFHKVDAPPCDHCNESPKAISHVMLESAEEFKEKYYGIGYPLIITRVTGYHDVKNTFQGLQDLYWMYQDDMEEDALHVHSTSGQITTLRHVFSSDGNSVGENVLWKTGYGNGMRILRKMYPRPFFINSEGALERFTMILNPQDVKRMVVPRNSFSNIWFAQVTGRSEILIQPKDKCKQSCPSYMVTLKKGEVLYSFQELWELKVKAVGSELGIVHISSFF